MTKHYVYPKPEGTLGKNKGNLNKLQISVNKIYSILIL
jgi:hypothetical protein